MCISLLCYFLHLREEEGDEERKEEGGGGKREPNTDQDWELVAREKSRHTRTSSIVASSFP